MGKRHVFFSPLLAAEKGSGQGRLLPGPDIRPLLVPASPQQDPEEDGILPE